MIFSSTYYSPSNFMALCFKEQLMNYFVILRLYCVGDILQASEDQDALCVVNEATQALETEISMWI
jgi:hypothetical protein